ncbi:MAG: acyl carrier protein [Nanoarchaeota archaeon]
MDKLAEFLQHNLGIDAEKIDQDTPLIETALVDSFGIINLVAFVEETFGIRLDSQELTEENFSSLRDIEQLIRRKTG